MKPVTSPSPFSPRNSRPFPPVTQLYLSVDAAGPDTLAEIDCPYVGKTDAWHRLNESLSILSTRQERTAIRITVIKKLNCRREDIPGYVKLIRLGPPCFIELKAFSFVGGTRHRHGFFLSSLLPTFPGQTSVLSMQGGLRLPLKVITGAVSVHHESKAVLMCAEICLLGGKWTRCLGSILTSSSLYGSPDFDALSYSIPIHDDRLITPDDRLITPDEDSSLKKPPPRVTVKKTTTLFMAML
ncbi:S-adenosyl-L-methionine-dependent tRNA 4-demethylwyosine synthase like protein [Aduncisulcus paluster]|uniref:S-adenosyl-L-methionine-dependent tRNA 4-demethylwyosine synthase like protein n=1 Tax=Aduncisulcus paluster TaxID=2918883 RepID=A0ABQ5JTC0_9EUKA|nr:S-adenosyl-L-methionine-dependent tRNA 4-demethylwyosine synthase like protein [Aduncisulcus paluster]